MFGDLIAPFYLWIKALHIIAVISWMAGLLYLPRLFVHHEEKAKDNSETTEIFKLMEMKLYKLIMTPAMIVAWACGLAMLVMPGIVDFSSEFWIWVKLLSLTCLTGFHFWLNRCRIAFAENRNEISGRQYRLMNEVPTVLMIVIVIMVIVRPF